MPEVVPATPSLVSDFLSPGQGNWLLTAHSQGTVDEVTIPAPDWLASPVARQVKNPTHQPELMSPQEDSQHGGGAPSDGSSGGGGKGWGTALLDLWKGWEERRDWAFFLLPNDQPGTLSSHLRL